MDWNFIKEFFKPSLPKVYFLLLVFCLFLLVKIVWLFRPAWIPELFPPELLLITFTTFTFWLSPGFYFEINYLEIILLSLFSYTLISMVSILKRNLSTAKMVGIALGLFISFNVLFNILLFPLIYYFLYPPFCCGHVSPTYWLKINCTSGGDLIIKSAAAGVEVTPPGISARILNKSLSCAPALEEKCELDFNLTQGNYTAFIYIPLEIENSDFMLMVKIDSLYCP